MPEFIFLFQLSLIDSRIKYVICDNKTMRISPQRIKVSQKLLKEQTGKDYSDEEAQQAGLAIVLFVIAKERQNNKLKSLLISNCAKTVSLVSCCH